MNEVLNTSHISTLSQDLPYSEYYNLLNILNPNIPFTEAPKLLLLIPTNNRWLIDLCIDNFIRIYSHTVIYSYHEVKRYFNIVTNMFNLIFKQIR